MAVTNLIAIIFVCLSLIIMFSIYTTNKFDNDNLLKENEKLKKQLERKNRKKLKDKK